VGLKGVAVRWSRVAYALEEQTTTRGSLAVSSATIETAIIIKEVF